MLSSILIPFRRYPWWALVLVLAVEFVTFDQFGVRHYTWIYPRWNDQIQYLTECYTAYEYAKVHGFGDGLWQALVNRSAQGTLHDFFALIVFRFAGPSRSAALSLNALAFLAWQAAFFFAARQRLQSTSLAWTAFAFTLWIRSPWLNGPGSAFDFRLDWMAACAMGIALAAGLWAGNFRSNTRATVFGVAVGIALLVRFLTGTYFAGVYFALAIWLATKPDRRSALVRLIFSGVIAALVAGPLMWINRESIYIYYWIGHFVGPESALRSPQMGVGRSTAWLLTHLGYDQLGVAFLVCAGVAIVIAGGGALLLDRRAKAVPSPQELSKVDWPPHERDWLALSIIFFALPALILVLHRQKSDVVLAVLIPGLLAVLLGLWARIARAKPRSGRAMRPAFAAAAMVVGGVHFVTTVTAGTHDPDFERDARKVNMLADYIYAHAKSAGLTNPRVGVDRVTDCLDGQVLRVICYERKKEWVPFLMMLPTGVTTEKDSLLMERLQSSDFVFLTDQGSPGFWPYDRQMQALHPIMSAWSDEHLRRVEDFDLFGQHMVLYQRREIP